MFSKLRNLLLASLTAVLAACPGPAPQTPSDAGQSDTGLPDAGEVETGFRIAGPLELTAASVSGPVRVGVLWFPERVSEELHAPAAAASAAQPLSSPLPERWSLRLPEAPPLAARGVLTTKGGGSGTVSWGVLVAFKDRDGDGRLTLDAQGRSPDELLGSSAGAAPFDLDGPGTRWLVEWRDGPLGTDEAGLVQGFNLMRSDEAFQEPKLLAPGTDLPLTLSLAPRLALTFCAEAYALPTPERACGQQVFTTPRVEATVSLTSDLGFAMVALWSGARQVTTAQVTINGVPMVESEGQFSFLELFQPTVVTTGRNLLRIEAPGFETLTLVVNVPAAPVIVSPAEDATLHAGNTTEVTWTGEATMGFDVTLTDRLDGSVSDQTQARIYPLAVPNVPGPALLTVSALSTEPLVRHIAVAAHQSLRNVTIVAE